MRLEQDRLSQLKNYIYIGSSALLFIVWCLSLAALTQTGHADGRLAWVFGLCFLTIPMLIYQSLTPIWSRTSRFSNPHAHCIVDSFLVVLWLSAWASLTSYVLSGKGKGDANANSTTSYEGCDNFLHGNAAKCKISEADIVFSVLMMLCFLGTGWFSFKVLMEYRRTGVAPNAAYTSRTGKDNISYSQKTGHKEDDEAFDASMDLHPGDGGRETGYSIEAPWIADGAPAPYGGLPSGYASVPNGPDEYGHGPGGVERPMSFGGSLNNNRP